MEETTEQVVTVLSMANNSTFLDSKFRYTLFSVAYSIFFVVGFLANSYVLFVLQCLRDAQNMGEIRIYMTNLTVADLLFVCALPFWISYYSHGGHWIFEDFMCRLTGSLFYINTYGSILFLGAISLNRYWAVAYPLNTASTDHTRRGIIVCVLIWLCTMSVAIPNLTTEGTHTDSDNMTRCFEGYHNETDTDKQKLAATHFLIIGLFFIVFFLVMVCNLLIARTLVSQKAPQSMIRSETLISKYSKGTLSSTRQRKRGMKQRALQLLLAVVAVFVLCFLPHHVVQAPWVLAVLKISKGWGHVDWDQNTLQILNDAHQITLVLMGLNCILDPVVYYFATRKFRKIIMGHLKSIGKGEGCSKTLHIQFSVDSRNNSHMPQSVQLHRDGSRSSGT